ncbi:MAG: hypothetical protein KXJ53_00500 [Phenylobacterium sp.]|jgi:hypothetical protein|nr:hypothetical protein [Phenylobacterium sp.]
MAKLPDLVSTTAKLTGEDEASIKVLARSLREGGLIKTGGRGRNGADMGWDDAASMVLGLASSADRTKVAEDVSYLRACTSLGGFVLAPKTHFTLSADGLRATFPFVSDELTATLAQLLASYETGVDAPPVFIPFRFSYVAYQELLKPRWDESSGETKVDHMPSSAPAPLGELAADLSVVSIELEALHAPHAWIVTLVVTLGSGITIVAFFDHPREADGLPISRTTTTTIRNLFFDGIVRRIRDEPPRQWPENEG